jgi:hypothetical protein
MVAHFISLSDFSRTVIAAVSCDILIRRKPTSSVASVTIDAIWRRVGRGASASRAPSPCIQCD